MSARLTRAVTPLNTNDQLCIAEAGVALFDLVQGVGLEPTMPLKGAGFTDRWPSNRPSLTKLWSR